MYKKPSFHDLLLSDPFDFLVGPKLVRISIPVKAITCLSEPLNALVNNRLMQESTTGVAELQNTPVEVFIAFCEFALTGDYQNPAYTSHESDEDYTNLFLASDPGLKVEEIRALRESAVEPTINDTWGTALAKRDKKGSRVSGLPTEELHTAGETTTNRLWKDFRVSRAGWLQQDQTQPPPNLLFHAKLYAFAEEKLVVPLKVCCLYHLHVELLAFDVNEGNSDQVLRLLHFSYSSRSWASSTGEDALRQLVSHYAASKLDVLLTLRGFRSLLDNYGELGSDIIRKLFT